MIKREKNCTSTWFNQFDCGKKEIGIFELAELLGVTSEALRKYENKEIIQPIRDQRGYRKFYSWDLTKIIYARQMRQEGFSLNDVSDIAQNNDAQFQIEKIEEIQKTLMQEILYRKKLINWLSAQKEEVMHSEQQGNRCVIEHLPALYCCVYMVDDTLVDKKGDNRKHLKQWLQALPFCSVCYIGAKNQKALSCLVLTEEELHAYNLEHLVPDFVVPEQYYAISYGTAEHDDEHDTSEECFLRAFHNAKTLNVKLSGYVIARMIRYVQNGKAYASINKMCVPIDDE